MSTTSDSLTRRDFLKVAVSGAGVMLLAACGGATAPAPAPTAAPAKPAEAPKPAAPAAPAAKAPVTLKGTALHVAQWQSFIKAADPFFADQVSKEFEPQTGAKVTLETVDFNQLQPKYAAAIQSGSGPDVIQLFHFWPFIYADSLVDVSDVTAEVEKAWGGIYEQLKTSTSRGGKYLAVPFGIVGNAFAYRESWLKEVGYEKFPDDWTEFADAGKKLKAKSRPIGQSLGHSIGDPVTFVYPLMWSFGGKEVEKDGKTVAINSKETVESVKWLVSAWRDAFDEGGVGWDDSANNRAFLGQQLSISLNGASIFWAARNDKAPFWEDINHGIMPKGPAGRFHWHVAFSHGIPKYSKNQEAAKEFIRWMMSEPAFDPWIKLQEGYTVPPGPKFEDNPMWTTGPKAYLPYKDIAKYGRALGYEGPASLAAAEVQAKYIVVDMYARAVQGEAPEAAVRWAEDEMKPIYAKA